MLCNIYYILLFWQIYLTNYLEIQVWIQNSWTPWTSVWGELGHQLMASSVFVPAPGYVPRYKEPSIHVCEHSSCASTSKFLPLPAWRLSWYAECGLEGAEYVLSRHVPLDLRTPLSQRAQLGKGQSRPLTLKTQVMQERHGPKGGIAGLVLSHNTYQYPME